MTELATIAQPPSSRQKAANVAFLWLCRASAWLTLALVAYIVVEIVVKASPAVRQYGLSFLTGRRWDPNEGAYGILAQTWGTLYSSLLALVIGGAFGVAAAIFLAEGFLAQAVFLLLKTMKVEYHPVWGTLPDRVEDALRNLIELLAAIPDRKSVV